MDIKDKVRALNRQIPALFLSLKDPQTPWTAKVLAGITVAYALSPIDLIPDCIPVLGYVDDIIILPFLVALTVKLIPHDVWTRNLATVEAEGMWVNGRPKKWYYAIPILIIWGLLAWLIYAAIFGNKPGGPSGTKLF